MSADPASSQPPIHILIASPNNAELSPVLRWAGLQVSECHSLDEFSSQVEYPCDLILLDENLSGYDLSKALDLARATGRGTPMIVLGSGGPIHRAMALDAGIDDFLLQPADSHELISRIRAVLRRHNRKTPNVQIVRRLQSGDLVIDRVSRRAWLAEVELPLTPRAFNLLEFLMMNPAQLVTREHLLENVWGWDQRTGIRAVDTRVFELRRALGDERADPHFIETISGRGYRFIAPVEVTS